MRIAVSLVFLTIATGARAQESNPVIGSWAWNPVQGSCPEIHRYAADGTVKTQSGNEVLNKAYTVTPVSGGMYLVKSVVIATNGGRDCLDSTTAVGTTSSVYIQPLNGGGYFTCATEDGMSCFGSARPQAAQK